MLGGQIVKVQFYSLNMGIVNFHRIYRWLCIADVWQISAECLILRIAALDQKQKEFKYFKNSTLEFRVHV